MFFWPAIYVCDGNPMATEPTDQDLDPLFQHVILARVLLVSGSQSVQVVICAVDQLCFGSFGQAWTLGTTGNTVDTVRRSTSRQDRRWYRLANNFDLFVDTVPIPLLNGGVRSAMASGASSSRKSLCKW
jgi:hypothetical protein